MKRMIALLVSVFFLTACNLPAEITPDSTAQTDAQQAVLLFGIGVHIEPLGVTAQGYKGGNGDYNNLPLFERHAENLLTLAQIVASHGGALTVQAQSPFTTVAMESGNTALADLAADGHEIALHFHEDAHLGKNPERLPPEAWCEVMKEEIRYLEQASGVDTIRYWSGGNLYPNLFQAAECAALDVNSDWKNPKTQTTDLALTGLHPWRPSGGTDGRDTTVIATHDPNGAIIFLPEGGYKTENFASMRRSEESGGDQAYFDFLAQSLYDSLAAAEAGKVNVFHFTVHPGEFLGDPAHPFEVIDKFLREVVDPLVASGQVQWATFSEMADSYAIWEAANPGVSPR